MWKLQELLKTWFCDSWVPYIQGINHCERARFGVRQDLPGRVSLETVSVCGPLLNSWLPSKLRRAWPGRPGFRDTGDWGLTPA